MLHKTVNKGSISKFILSKTSVVLKYYTYIYLRQSLNIFVTQDMKRYQVLVHSFVRNTCLLIILNTVALIFSIVINHCTPGTAHNKDSL